MRIFFLESPPREDFVNQNRRQFRVGSTLAVSPSQTQPLVVEKCYAIGMSQSRLALWLANEWEQFDGLEKRRVLRSPCDWPACLRQGDESWIGKARDVSSRGLRMSIPLQASVRRGELVELQTLRPVREPLRDLAEGKICWVRRSKGECLVGVSFANLKEIEHSWLYSLLASVFHKDSDQKRTSLRVSCSMAVHLRGAGGLVPGQLLDLSIGGALLECEQSYSSGSTIEMTLGPWAPLPALKIACKVQRILKPGELFRYGVRFQVGDGNRQALLDYVRLSYAKGRKSK